MKCHQILTGAANKGDKTFGVGSVEGIPFATYSAGGNVVILSSDFDRVQIIPGVCHADVQIQCLAASTDTGKIAAAYGNIIIIFEPTPLVEQNSSHGLDYWWVETAKLESECQVASLAWNNDGNRLITAGEFIQIWQHKTNDSSSNETQFTIGEEGKGDQGLWSCFWKNRPANPIHYLAFSPDGTLFATAGKNDRLVRIWYQSQQILFPNTQTQESLRQANESKISFSYIYLAHPRSVTGMSWRKTSKYMPKGAMANMLVSSCLDNICRLWCETVLPEDGIVNMSQLDPNAAKDSKFRTHRQKARFIQRFRHIRQSFAARKLGKQSKNVSKLVQESITTLPSTYSVHDFHSYGFHGSNAGISPGLHFHLASTINARTDIPLVPAIHSGDARTPMQHRFVLHWLNNKEMHFTREAEKIMEDLFRLAVEKSDDSNFDLELGEDAVDNAQPSHDVSKAPQPPSRPPPPKRGGFQQQQKRAPSSSSLAQSDVSHHGSIGGGSNSSGGGASNPFSNSGSLSDHLDHRIDRILKDWHQDSDLLFSIHPVDGSLLVWVADYLDEYLPGSFRQAQVSFSSRIPNALPLGDAMTMGATVELFNAEDILNLKELFKDLKSSDDKKVIEAKEATEDDNPESSKQNETEEEEEDVEEESPAKKIKSKEKYGRYKPPPLISMISKHSNGTLNLWSVMFSEKSKFSQLLNISHKARASGHRFRVNAVTCHPVLPLLLTTSHHNIVRKEEATTIKILEEHNQPEVFCSELILWRVDSVGPLSNSGGITELARINSKEISAFADVAWIPTLLPSTTLGTISNSPSACFVASDGHSLRAYQAVIDARTLLSELNTAQRKSDIMAGSNMSLSSGHSSSHQINNAMAQESLKEKFKIVSTQSTAKPGAIIELEAISDATQNWQNTLLLHAFQEQLILSQGSIPSNLNDSVITTGLITSKMSAIVDLEQHTSGFREPFYTLVAEKVDDKVMIHMWRLVITSKADQNEDENVTSGSITPDHANFQQALRSQNLSLAQACEVHVVTEKVCMQQLDLPEGVEVIHAVPAVGHLSSASIYPACLAPYVMVTACSDHKIRFWRVIMTAGSNDDSSNVSGNLFTWQEWRMASHDGASAITLPGIPVSVSAAYSGRIACAYQTGHSFKRPQIDPNTRYVNLCVGIYECESTGGADWILEDTISLKNIEIQPEIPEMDFSVYQEDGSKKSFDKMAKQFQTDKDVKGLFSVPSLSTFDGVKRYISKMGNAPSNFAPKQSVMLDWVSNEDGSHILTIAVGNKVLFLTAVSSDISQASMKAINEAKATAASSRPLLRKSSSMGFQQFPDEIRWMQIRSISLRTADGLTPTPMSISWVRDGILMCGMDNEITVFSQWKENSPLSDWKTLNNANSENGRNKEIVEHRNLQEEDILNLAQESQMRNVRNNASFSNLTKSSSQNAKKKGVGLENREVFQDLMPDFGLFEAAHIACPVLPQYHPKQLMELLNSGKIRWVKAILGHLVRCIGGTDRARMKSGSGSFTGDLTEGSRSPARNWSRSRTLSVSASQAPLSPGSENQQRVSLSLLPEEVTLDYTEINSIPPLPLWTLLAADRETVSSSTAKMAEGNDGGYEDLFSNTELMQNEDNLDTFLEDEDEFDAKKKKKRHPTEKQGLSYFGPRQARILSKLLTHAHLPGLTSLDQMHLLALADTVASCQLDLADRFAIDAAKRQMAKETSSSLGQNEPSPESLDDCGLRFLLAMKHFAYLQRCLPISQRKQLLKQGLATSYLIWGFHSESEDELLSMIPCVAKNSPNWIELRELGVGWWVRSNTVLRRLFEKVAKTAFQAHQDPLDAAVFYLAMKKKSLVWGLYRSIKDEKMTQFFSNDFTQDRWRKAALKNAFALLGKQRFLHATAFFLLSGSLQDALDICIDKLDDLQLAMVIARLYDGEINQTPDSLKGLLYKHILGREKNGENEDLDMAHPDPFLRSMALWIDKEYSASLATLVDPDIGTLHPKFTQEEEQNFFNLKRKAEADPSVFNFYIYLRTHPLIARHQMAKNTKESKAIQLSGFRTSSIDKGGSNANFGDSVTSLERRLYFSTAHFHLRGGCPALAVEVLSKLPCKVTDEQNSFRRDEKDIEKDSKIETGTFDMAEEVNWSSNQESSSSNKKKEATDKESDDFDWGAPISSKLKSEDDQLELDWSQPTLGKDEDELKLEWSDDPESEEGDSASNLKGRKASDKGDFHNDAEEEDQFRVGAPGAAGAASGNQSSGALDIMAQQLKFIACLKIMMEELSTLATGFEVDGGLLRYQLYIWLEREVEALKQLCNYGVTEMKISEEEEEKSQLYGNMRELFAAKGRRPTLHEVMMAEKADFEAKVNRAMRRKQWLKANQTLLRTLLSYCGLHGSNGGGLASVRMELILLLQELQQEKTQKQLLSPLPFPTTLPLLSACIAQQKTVVIDPVRHLQAMAHDMLNCMVTQKHPPLPGVANYAAIFLLRDISVALSSCVYQALCDSDSVNLKKLAAKDGPASAILEALSRLSVVYQDSSLIATSAQRKLSMDGNTTSVDITTEPSKWPGVTSLRALLDREKDEETPNLNVLLCETFVAMYMSILSYALASCDAQILYRLVSQKITSQYWSQIFGGGTKKTIQIETATRPSITKDILNETMAGSEDSEGGMAESPASLLNTMTSLTKKRVQLNMKILGMQLGPSGQEAQNGQNVQEKQSYREQFVPPELSIINKLLAKPNLDGKDQDIDYDSGEESDTEVDDEDDDAFDDDPFSNVNINKAENIEHSNPNSFSWCLIRFACIRLAQNILEKFVTTAGIELAELPVASPLIYASLRITEAWLDSTLDRLNNIFGSAPDNYIPGCFPATNVSGPAIEKYKSLFEIENTPFISRGRGIGPIKRLWQYLVRQKPVQNTFIKFIFSKRKPAMTANLEQKQNLSESQSFVSRLSAENIGPGSEAFHDTTCGQLARMNQPVKIIHKDHESVTAFCINKVSTGLMTLATQKEIQELNISLLLNPNSWNEGMNDEADFDVLNLNEDPETLPASNYLVVQTPGDNFGLPGIPPGAASGASGAPGTPIAPSLSSGTPSGPGPGPPTSKGTSMVFSDAYGSLNPFDHKMKGHHFPGSQNSQFCRLVIQRSRHLLKPVRRHRVDGTRRLAAHSHLPLYVTGSQDGSVRMWEWSHNQSVQSVRPPGVFAKVNRVRFTAQGNKFGVCDGDGTVSLWQAANATSPFFNFKCHNKQTSDFAFQGGCASLFSTAGHSNDGKNVALWDTLLPQKRCMVQSFTFHEQGASSIIYAPQHYQLVTAGKKGFVSIWDLRTQKQLHFFKAHDHAIKCSALDANEEFLVTGSVAGDIKIWNFTNYKCCYNFPEEHCRHGIFKNISQGVLQVFVDQQKRLFSCGADGSMKIRQLPDRDFIVSTFGAKDIT